MKSTQRSAAIILLILLGATVYALIRTGTATPNYLAPTTTQISNPAEPELIDQRPLQTAQQFAKMTTTAEEKPFVEEALALADKEMDLAFAAAVLDAIRILGLEMQVIFNKGAVMVLPSGINKASGLRAALAEMKLSVHNVVGVGDAENDHAFLSVCECAVAVANAVPLIKERADIVTSAGKGAGGEPAVDLRPDDARLHAVLPQRVPRARRTSRTARRARA